MIHVPIDGPTRAPTNEATPEKDLELFEFLAGSLFTHPEISDKLAATVLTRLADRLEISLEAVARDCFKGMSDEKEKNDGKEA